MTLHCRPVGRGRWRIEVFTVEGGRTTPFTVKVGERFPLGDLPPGPARRNGDVPQCGLFCEMAEQEYGA